MIQRLTAIKALVLELRKLAKHIIIEVRPLFIAELTIIIHNRRIRIYVII